MYAVNDFVNNVLSFIINLVIDWNLMIKLRQSIKKSLKLRTTLGSNVNFSKYQSTELRNLIKK